MAWRGCWAEPADEAPGGGPKRRKASGTQPEKETPTMTNDFINGLPNTCGACESFATLGYGRAVCELRKRPATADASPPSTCPKRAMLDIEQAIARTTLRAHGDVLQVRLDDTVIGYVHITPTGHAPSRDPIQRPSRIGWRARDCAAFLVRAWYGTRPDERTLGLPGWAVAALQAEVAAVAAIEAYASK